MNFFEGAIAQSNGHVVFQSGFETPVDAVRAKLWRNAGKRSATLGLRPEHIAEVAHGGVPAVVERVEAAGLENLVYCSCSGASFVSRLPADRATKRGDTLAFRFDMEHALFFDPETGSALAG